MLIQTPGLLFLGFMLYVFMLLMSMSGATNEKKHCAKSGVFMAIYFTFINMHCPIEIY